jgi:hypothetical protein
VNIPHYGRRNSIFNIMTRLQVGQFGVQFLAGAREFSQKIPDQLWVHPVSCSMGNGVISLKVMWLGHKVGNTADTCSILS